MPLGIVDGGTGGGRKMGRIKDRLREPWDCPECHEKVPYFWQVCPVCHTLRPRKEVKQ
jgi:hypothetical protein